MQLVNAHVDGTPFDIKIHTTRADCSRQPKYIKDGKAECRLGKLNGIPTNFYYGDKNPDERISFEINEIWCYVDAATLASYMRDLETNASFTTDGEFNWNDFPTEDFEIQEKQQG